MFERFTDRARSVVVLAQDEARMLRHNYIGTEHILLGLIRDSDGVAAKVLQALGISLEAVRQQVREIIGQGKHEVQSGNIPFTPRAKKVLELSLREALQLGHSYIGTEHILLGLIHEGEGVAAQVLVKLGADLSVVRMQVIQEQADNPTTEELPRVAQARAAARAKAGRAEAARAEAARAEAGGSAGKLDEILSRLDSISDRLAAIEQALSHGTAPDDD